MSVATEIKSTLESALPDATVIVEDLTGGGDHFQAVVVSSKFEGKGLVEQHQLVYGALSEALEADRIHALALKTYTPEEWDRRQQKGCPPVKAK
jgi:acid stress-induced BolA-like protein IbaG/YrbA